MYLCYIKVNDTADGYFGYYIKSNGNIFSINERVNEAYPSAHHNSRNNRWSDDKKYDLFPYNFIFSFGEHDYKGYAGSHIINDEELGFFHLGPEAYFPIILAMIMLAKKYAGKTLDSPIKYVDSLLPINAVSLAEGENALIVPENSLVADNHRSLKIAFDNDKILTGEYQKRFNYKDNEQVHYMEKGVYTESGQEFVDLYGGGFAYDPNKVLKANSHIKQIEASEEKHNLNAEFIGSKGRMELEAYRNIREQLAEYIRDKMFEEYTAFAGTKAGIRKVQPLDKRLCGKRIPIRMDGISETKKIKRGCGIKQRKELMETIGSFLYI